MAREYHFFGRFKVTTDCPDLDKISKALNENARSFYDTLRFKSEAEGDDPPARGYMWIYSDVEVEIPVNEPVEEELEEEESEVEGDD
jgi:hypothetical protein